MPARTREKANAQQRRWYEHNKVKHILLVRRKQKEVFEWFIAYKKTLSCKCGESDSRCLDFHHRNPEEKKGNVASMVRRTTMKALKEELAKCDVMCANCHRKHHK